MTAPDYLQSPEMEARAKEKPETRVCLRCRKDFVSVHRLNRMCRFCQMYTDNVSGGMDE